MAADLAVHAPDARAQRPQRRAHAPELPGVRIAADLHGQPRGGAGVALAHLQAMRAGGLEQVLAALLQQPAFGGMGHGFQHDGGIHDHALEAGTLDEAAPPGGLDGEPEQQLDAFLPDAPPPARQARRVHRRTRLKVRLAGEVLPVRVLHPGLNHRLVGGLEGVLQVQQPRHQACRQRRAAATGGEVSAEAVLDLLPVDEGGEAHQRVAEVDLLVEPRPRRKAGKWCRLGLHRAAQHKLQEHWAQQPAAA